MNWIDTNTLIAICACAIGLTQFFLWRYIARNKSYESEKGKNLATKEDVKDITQKVEEIKNIYSSSLERYKIDLQKELETSKYIIELCHSLDKELIMLISKALKSYVSPEIGMPHEYDDKDLISSAHKISNFLYIYRTRYGSKKEFYDLNDIAFKIKCLSDIDMETTIPETYKADFIFLLHSASSTFLPKFK
ncbi:hypothetical protein [uncultured Parabacteroides sp.]|jgi:hypothetical protein|uniref:hypothetical protein n=1 Tax=uncultured Parabacteroides sp. TaxID=512312 RepID=UPI0025F3AA9D|nr:hypothetical protein [uncultured Parabacteroides sp.]